MRYWGGGGKSCKDNNSCFVTAGADSRPTHASSIPPSTLIQASYVLYAFSNAVFMAGQHAEAT
jgi:hypothetical protein